MAAAEAKRATRPHPQQMVKCPRCESPDTKFCYYNNYSTTQPRYFCKNCKRYWTDGGTLRNVPVGGGLRKNKRSNKTKIPNTTSSSPPLPPSSSMHNKPSSSTPSSCNIMSNIASNHAILNLSTENQHALPHSSSMPGSGYLVFNPRIYEAGDQATHANLPYQEGSFSHQIVPPSSLSLLAGGLKQQGPPSTAPFFSGYGHERPALVESLQPAGLIHHSGMDAGVNYPVNNFVNVNDWQQISEGLFGSGGESNFMFMQAPHPPQWADFDSGTRL